MSSTPHKVLEDAGSHLPVMYEGALSILETTSNPLRFVFCALGFRELFREFFAAVAPDSAVQDCRWWQNKGEAKVTRRDRITFFIHGYVHPKCFDKRYVDQVDAAASRFLKKIDGLSRRLHVTRDRLLEDEVEQQDDIHEALEQFEAVLKLADSYHHELKDSLKDLLTTALTEEFCLGSAFDNLDCLSTHTRPTGACDIEVEIVEIDEDHISFEGTGSVECDLQYGSDGDVRRGDGVEFCDSFPFSFRGTASSSDPKNIDVPREEIDIDNSKFWH